jgi:hypothetical protein
VITAPPQRVLEVEWRLLRPRPHRLLSGLLQQNGKCWLADHRQFERENLKQGMAIVDRSMTWWKRPAPFRR